jgi:hypothetical protein
VPHQKNKARAVNDVNMNFMDTGCQSVLVASYIHGLEPPFSVAIEIGR